MTEDERTTPGYLAELVEAACGEHPTFVEFDCADCGSHVFALGLARPPVDRLCAECRWFTEAVPDPVERERLMRRMSGRHP